ncbi:LOW QUALITY PROTEIN: uncharacterized protein LOC125947615 [Dermacentor silvarum]|uniref:LOW QUALITY PROTEIN: uncharacterized protein LOC125947615 n=1 Tax=Dermacentor silvarum TaxID=543639 RepID=UPI00210124A9|nr:LOW QUALITY PROTEIN: uncharacterized protein LOC125947615 [Dermacentor silvarum]
MNHQHAQASTLNHFISSTTGPFSCSVPPPNVLVSYIAVAVCRARAFAYCIRVNILPPEVKFLCAGFTPSIGHGVRICKILRSEWQRQARLYRDSLYLQLQRLERPSTAKKKWRELCALTDRTTEFLWQRTLTALRDITPKKSPQTSNRVHIVGDVDLPEKVRQLLSLGPKFAVEPRKTPHELLTLVRQISQRIPEGESNRCVSEGVDILLRRKPPCSALPTKHVASFLKARSLVLLPSDKEGGFAVLPSGTFNTKATLAIDSVFRREDGISLTKVKSEAKRLCNALSLDKLAKSVEKSTKLSLDFLFTAKTHKNDCPLRVMVTENGTWQKSVAIFLQNKLNLLTIDDPYLVRDSDAVIEFLKGNNKALRAFSIDVKDLYYSLPHDEMLKCVEGCIDNFGSIAFQNETGVAVSGFLEMLTFYLKSTFVSWEESQYIQKSGICIGSCLAPVLSDIYLAKKESRTIQTCLDMSLVAKVCRYVDDFLVLIECPEEVFEQAAGKVLDVFRQNLHPLELTHELPENNSLRFLDVKLCLSSRHLCWSFEPRSGKPLLSFKSAHSKLVKRGIINVCLVNALRRSCPHSMQISFDAQVDRLLSAGYTKALISAVAEKLCKQIKLGENNRAPRPPVEKKKLAVLPYIHDVSHKLKRVGQRAGVAVVFSAPEKLSKLCRFGSQTRRGRCTVKHRNPLVSCTTGVVYMIPLSCGKKYVGQTGRCINDRLREHHNNVYNTIQGHLGIHCRDHGCKPYFDKSEVLARHNSQLTREIIEADFIRKFDSSCVSSPSIALSSREIAYLNNI